MPFEPPVIDDRSYENLRNEVRARIPRYTPEWTDLNENDPGIVLSEVFCWLSEQLIYRMGRVPELNYLKFMELIGIQPTPAACASAEVSFAVQDKPGLGHALVPAGTRVAAAEPDETGPIVFETERALHAIAARLDRVLTAVGGNYYDRTEVNNSAAGGFFPFGESPAAGDEVLFGFNSEEPFPEVEIDLTFFSSATEQQGAMECGDVPIYSHRMMRWEYWGAGAWQPMMLLSDGTAALTRSGHFRLGRVASGNMQRTRLGNDQAERYWIRAVLVDAGYDLPPRLLAVRTNTVMATQAETIGYEVLGGSNGRRDQLFSLSHTPILDQSLDLRVDEGDGDGVVQWTEVTDFYASGPDGRHYTLNRTTGEVRFGDGKDGRIPVANPERSGSSIVAWSYRFGGGSRGNLPPGALNTLQGSVLGIDSGGTKNWFQSDGGGEEETLQQAKRRVAQSLKSRNRAVTLPDFEMLARQVGPVARAKAYPLRHPDYPRIPVPGSVTVVVVPHADKDDPTPAPTPSSAALRAVCACLGERRLLTTEVHVTGPTYRQVRVRAELFVGDDTDVARVKQDAIAAVNQYFHPLTGGEDGAGWPFGGDIYYSLLVGRLMLDGVRRVSELVVEVDGEAYPRCEDVVIDDGVLLAAGEHEIEVSYQSEATS